LYKVSNLSLQVRLIESIIGLKAIEDSWRDLYENTSPPQGHPFNCFSWLFPYAQLLEHQGSLLKVFIVLERDKLIGIAPLQVPRTSLFGLKRIQFLGHPFSDYCDLIYCQNRETIVVETLVKHWQSVFGSGAVFDLRGFHESSPTPLLLRDAIQRLGGQIYQVPWEKAPALCLTDGCEPRTDILQNILSKRHCRKRLREMDKLGKARFMTITPENGLECQLERIFYYHRLRWHEKRTYVHSMSEDMQRMYVASISQMAREGHAEIFVLIVNDVPYAYAVVLKRDKHAYYLMPTHNIYAPYSPGTSLLYHIFRYMKNAGYRELDFTIGQEAYKTRFSNIVRQNRRVIFTFNSSIAFARIMKIIDHVRTNEILIRHIRAWREKSHQINYTVRDYFSRRLAQLKRLDYNRMRLSLHEKQIFGKESCLIYRLPLDGVSCHNTPEYGLRIQKVSVPEAIKFVCRLHQCDSPAIWGDLLRRELQGAECYGGFIDGELIHTSWVGNQQNFLISEIGETLDLKEGECCIFDCNTLPEYRGRGVYPQTLMYIAQRKKISGFNFLYIYTFSSNLSSIRGIEKTGFELSEVRQRNVNSANRFWR
jgi:CelD/BcsL family acetyltransferase involved in cellulose biosynthesis/GNAT superfamily N-acetyltransferase